MHYELWTMSQNLSLSAHLVRWEEGREAREERANMTMEASSSFSLGFCKLMCWEKTFCVLFFTSWAALLAFPPHEAEFTFIFPSSEIYVPIRHCITNKLKRTSQKNGPYWCARCAVQCAVHPWLVFVFVSRFMVLLRGGRANFHMLSMLLVSAHFTLDHSPAPPCSVLTPALLGRQRRAGVSGIVVWSGVCGNHKIRNQLPSLVETIWSNIREYDKVRKT